MCGACKPGGEGVERIGLPLYQIRVLNLEDAELLISILTSVSYASMVYQSSLPIMDHRITSPFFWKTQENYGLCHRITSSLPKKSKGSLGSLNMLTGKSPIEHSKTSVASPNGAVY
jgi:hypothetical protein